MEAKKRERTSFSVHLHVIHCVLSFFFFFFSFIFIGDKNKRSLLSCFNSLRLLFIFLKQQENGTIKKIEI